MAPNQTEGVAFFKSPPSAMSVSRDASRNRGETTGIPPGEWARLSSLERNNLWNEARKEKQSTLRNIKAANELNGCTFKPNLISSSSNGAGPRSSSQSRWRVGENTSRVADFNMTQRLFDTQRKGGRDNVLQDMGFLSDRGHYNQRLDIKAKSCERIPRGQETIITNTSSVSNYASGGNLNINSNHGILNTKNDSYAQKFHMKKRSRLSMTMSNTLAQNYNSAPQRDALNLNGTAELVDFFSR
jgi:hypothetical protein